MHEKRSFGAIGAIVLFLVLAFHCPIAAAQYEDGALYRENFEKVHSLKWAVLWNNRHRRTLSYTTNGIDGVILQVNYIPSSQGSERVLSDFALAQAVSSATLSYDLKLHSQFEFVRSGKLHGLTGGNATTGCRNIDPNGWSVRMAWMGSEGVPVLYIYHQDRVSGCGDTYFPTVDFEFRRGRWYRVDIYVKMNTGVGSADGRAMLFIEGEKLVDAQNLNLTGNSQVKIDKFAFHTFHGGDDSTYSPSETRYIYFDNFTVQPGRRITGERGTTCEIFREGIFHLYTASCCAESCGACGGPACDSLPGGADLCCNSRVTTNGRFCDVDGLSAPCSFANPEPE